MADPALRHHGYRDRVHDLLDPDRVRHSGDPARGADVRRDALQGHHGDGPGLFRDQCLLRVRDVHHDAAFLHLREAAFEQFGPESEFTEVQVKGHNAPRFASYEPVGISILRDEFPRNHVPAHRTLSERNDAGPWCSVTPHPAPSRSSSSPPQPLRSWSGSVAVLETFPRQPLFELPFVNGTVLYFAEVAIAFVLVGLLLIPVTFRGPGWRQWVLVASVLLASAGFSGGLWVMSLATGAS